MEQIIIANHKMYLNSLQDIDTYIQKLNKHKNQIIVLPQSIYLERFIKNGFTVGTQNVSPEKEGPYTSEISAQAINDIGGKYVLIGHSEVRQNPNKINKEIKEAINNHLKVILCVGENQKEKEHNQTKVIIKQQIKNAINNINEKIIIAYEPNWAIGSNQIPKKEDIQQIVAYIKSLFTYNIQVLYGGSVSIDNIKKLKEMNLDGYLIGQSSTDAEEFLKIIEVVLE